MNWLFVQDIAAPDVLKLNLMIVVVIYTQSIGIPSLKA